jgi:hypothetical protein
VLPPACLGSMFPPKTKAKKAKKAAVQLRDVEGVNTMALGGYVAVVVLSLHRGTKAAV